MATGSAIKVSSTGKLSTEKDPDAVLDYPFDWSAWLADIDDTYLSHSFVIVNPEGASVPIAVESSSESEGVITPFVSGGTLDASHILTCRINTVGGRTDDKSLKIVIKQQ